MEDYILLVERAKQGDSDSFAALYEQVADDLYRMALYTLGNVHDAQDVVAETFAEAYKGLGSLRDNAAFKAWITRILSIRCKRRIGQYIRRRNEMNIEDFLTLTDESENEMETALSRTDLVKAMSILTPAERQIIVLAVLQGYTTREVAQIVRAPHGTVSSKLHRALLKLRRTLQA